MKRFFTAILIFVFIFTQGSASLAFCMYDTSEQTEIVEIPYKTRCVPAPDKEEGESTVLTSGECGYKMIRTETTRRDGEIDSTYVTERIIAQPVTEVIAVGTKKTFGLPYIDYAHGGTDYAVTQYYGGSSGHIGIDFAVYYGAPIVAVMSGTVVEARVTGELPVNGSNLRWTYGTYVVIDHGNGFMTYYAHMSKKTVSAGDTVKKGQVIGYSGNTGRVSPAPTSSSPLAGTHLHFEIRKYNSSTGTYKTVDPTLYLPRWVKQ